MARKKIRLGDEPDDAPLEDALPHAPTDPELGPPGEGARIDLRPEPSVTAPADLTPVAVLATESPPVLVEIQARIDRLEHALAPLQQLDGLEERLFQRVTTYVDHTRSEVPLATTQVAEPSILAKASALGAVGKQVLTSMVMPAISASPPSGSRPPARPWAIREILAELMATFYMYVDPRYRLSWFGRVLPPVLLGLFLTTGWWVPFFLGKPIEIVLCFSLIKLLSHEARRYRETAADLPPWLRP